MNALVQTPALQNHLNAQVSLMTEMTNKLYDSCQRITELNLRFAQQLVEDLMNASRQLLSATDPVEFSSAAMACAMPTSEHLRNYQQQMMGMLAGAQVDLTRTAEQHIPETSRTASAVADEVVRRSTEATEKIAAEHRQAMERMNAQVRGKQPDGNLHGGEHGAARA